MFCTYINRIRVLEHPRTYEPVHHTSCTYSQDILAQKWLSKSILSLSLASTGRQTHRKCVDGKWTWLLVWLLKFLYRVIHAMSDNDAVGPSIVAVANLKDSQLFSATHIVCWCCRSRSFSRPGCHFCNKKRKARKAILGWHHVFDLLLTGPSKSLVKHRSALQQ